jgi:hypothetical protein
MPNRHETDPYPSVFLLCGTKLQKIRLPTGATLENTWESTTLLSDVNTWITQQTGESKLLLSISHPRKVYEKLDQEKTTLAEIPGPY